MLDGVDEIAWERLHGAYGAVERMPECLRALRSDDKAVRDEARDYVWDAVYHQGTRWQASAPTVPFLIALIDDPSIQDRRAIASVLDGAVTGDRRDDELPFDADKAFADADGLTEAGEARVIAAVYGDEPLDDADEEIIELGDMAAVMWERNAWRAAAERVDTIAGWVNDPDSEVAARAAALLAWLPATPRSVDALLQASDPAVVASTNLTLAHLPDADPRIDRHLQQLSESADRAIAVTAAVALAYRLGEAIPGTALTILIDAKDDPQLAVGITGWSRPLLGFVSLALQRLRLS
ncbi:hypothetical protein [Allorhizocola rhizosphaerae]|uniref:hypothetical protein n=1 Tax=Allorhizocola rhizosphaerae TaxID=1872709 RepID=UPI0013C2F3D9|nr:hypothetical protein [Allorhizocola rhizosphaerae]